MVYFDNPPNPSREFFYCLHCNAVTQQQTLFPKNANSALDIWDEKLLYICKDNTYGHERLEAKQCILCKDFHLFKVEYSVQNDCYEAFSLIYPLTSPVDLPSKDMPDNVKELYIEASLVLKLSPRSSCLLLRKALETLLYKFTKQDRLAKSITILLETNPELDSIKEYLALIKDFGNDGAHYREIDMSDNENNAVFLFKLINEVTSRLITLPNASEMLSIQRQKIKLGGS